MEYQEFAKYYDIFYQNKDYKKEVKFLLNFIDDNMNVLDIGCGTGIHASLLQKENISVDGLDLNKEMLDIAKKRIKGSLYNQNMLNIDINKKYNIIISMFAVLNHLKNTDELEIVFKNMSNILLPNGKILIDLHIPKSSGEKIDTYFNISRKMIWNYEKEEKIEISKIIFNVNNETFETEHIFKIFSIEDVIKCANKANLKVISIFENYDINKKGTNNSKNLQFLIQK